jgi:hypothetical protein
MIMLALLGCGRAEGELLTLSAYSGKGQCPASHTYKRGRNHGTVHRVGEILTDERSGTV